jgi:hydroxymethylpyrimidine pyrophosphatase-like HAD family hydrolase
VNDKRLPSLINHLSKDGFLFGLNSNRSLEDVSPIYKKFNLNGPIILENGVYFIFKRKKIFLLAKPKIITPRFIEGILVAFIKKENLNATIKIHDSVKALTSSITAATPLLFLVNKYRKFTGSIHILRYGKRDRILAQKLTEFIGKEFRQSKLDFTVTCPETFGNVIFYPKKSSKRMALQKIKAYYPRYHFYMIGDEMNDFKAIHKIGTFLTTGNATPRVKTMAFYVAKNTYTKGLVEILNRLHPSKKPSAKVLL